MKSQKRPNKAAKPIQGPPPPPKWIERLEAAKKDPLAISLKSKWLAEKRKSLSTCQANQFVFRDGEKIFGPATPYACMNFYRVNFGGGELPLNFEIREE